VLGRGTHAAEPVCDGIWGDWGSMGAATSSSICSRVMPAHAHGQARVRWCTAPSGAGLGQPRAAAGGTCACVTSLCPHAHASHMDGTRCGRAGREKAGKPNSSWVAWGVSSITGFLSHVGGGYARCSAPSTPTDADIRQLHRLLSMDPGSAGACMQACGRVCSHIPLRISMSCTARARWPGPLH